MTPDAETNTFTIEGFSASSTYPEKVYIIGGVVNGNSWKTNAAVEAGTASEGVYTREGVEIADAGSGYGYFTFITTLGTNESDWDTVNGSDRYGAETEDAEFSVDTPATVVLYAVNVSASGAKSWKVSPATYDVTLNLRAMTVVISVVTSGISSVEAEDAEAPVYYNLQGVRIDNPENGIFIEVRNNKAVKVVK